MRRLLPHLTATTLSALLLAGGLGCETNFTSLRFRPVDTTSQMTLQDVEIIVNGQTRATTNEHGYAEVRNLHAGDTVLLQKTGYETARIELKVGEYAQYSPAAEGTKAAEFPLQNLEGIAVPLHRQGAVRRP